MFLARRTIAVLLLSAASSAHATLRNKAKTCNDHKDEHACLNSSDPHNDDLCQWCDCKAVPSLCASASQAKRLPEGVFTCGDKKDRKKAASSSLSFSFLEGQTHTITDATVDTAFCDSSSPVSYSGYMDISGSKYDDRGENKHLFFWMHEKRGKTKSDDASVPLILWLTGGPGCSSIMALLTENGPCGVDKSGETTFRNPNSWTEAAHMLWLDQPAGVGYSYGKATDKNEEMVGEDAYYFLQAFYKAHPEYKKNPLFIFGESYGGHYAPAIAHRVYMGNKASNEGTEYVNLKGVAIGNGLTDPEIQYKYYPEMAYKNPRGIKAVNKVEYEAMKKAVPTCINMIKKCNSAKLGFMASFKCQAAFNYCNMAMQVPYNMSGKNPYDISKKCEVKPLCYDFSNITTFLDKESTRKALNVVDKSPKWQACNMSINTMFRKDWMGDFAPFVKDLLEAEISVLIYAGDLDFICNYMGNKAWALAMDWKYKDDFNKAEDHDWNNKTGLARTSHGFTFLQVYNAGHMSPTDQPEVTLEMVKQFTTDTEF